MKNSLCYVMSLHPTLTLCTSIFDSIHATGHPGMRTSTKIIKAWYFWPKMDKTIKKNLFGMWNMSASLNIDILEYLIQPIEIPADRFHTINIDIVGPLPPVKNTNDPYNSPYRYILSK